MQVHAEACAGAMEPNASGRWFQADYFSGLGERDTFQHCEDEERAIDSREFAEGGLQPTPGLHPFRVGAINRRAPGSRSKEALISSC